MPLFHVQDSDRPLWVVARDYIHAVQKWTAIIREENDLDAGEECSLPDGVALVCDDHDLVTGSQPGKHPLQTQEG